MTAIRTRRLWKEAAIAGLLLALTAAFFWKLALTNLILAGIDPLLYFYPYKDYAAEVLRGGRIPLWNPYLFMGAPFLANIQSAVFYPLNWPLIWLSPPRQVSFSIALHIFLTALGTYAFGRLSLRLGRSGALVAALTFALGGFVGAQVEHVNQLNGMAWLPLLFLLLDAASGGTETKARPGAIILLGLAIALQVVAGHTQTVYISLFGLGLYALLGPGRGKRRLLVYAAAVVVGAGLAAVQLLPTAELSRLSVRSEGLSYREATSFSLRPHLLLYTLLPAFAEDLSQVFGSEGFAEYISYVGVIPLLLALVGASEGWSRRPTRFFALLGGIGLGLALGLYNPLYFVLYKLLPGFGLFRAPARWMLLYSFALAVLSGIGVDCLLDSERGGFPGLRNLLARLRRVRLLWLVLAALFLAIPAGLLLIFLDFPAPLTLLTWLLLGGVAVAAIAARRRWAGRRGYSIALVALVGAELFAASRSLSYNNPTAPEAFSFLRPSVAHLKAATAGPDERLSRVISLSGIVYDPGDLAEIEQIFAAQLPPKAVYNYVVAAKEKEVLYYNLPLLYRLYSVDGYDGGVLPLRRFVTLQRLFLDEDDLSPDGRLREQLRDVPEGRLLSLLGVRYVITDKVYDVWIDGIFYDLQFTALLGPGGVQELGTGELPDFPATALGIVSFLEGGAELPQGTPLAEVVVADAQGNETSYTLRAGLDTAEGEYSRAGPVAHRQAQVGHHWRDNPEGNDYIAVVDWGPARRLSSITLRYQAPAGRLHLRGLSLIDRRTGTGESLNLSTGGHFRLVHSGDVKIYENLEALPRAYLVHRARVEPDDLAAVAAMRSPDFVPGEEIILAEGEPFAGHTSGADEVRITRYEPERVELAVRADSEGYLLLGDTYYPGWEVTVDGQPARLLRANLMFRAVHLPPGEHTVLFRYAPNSLRIGAIISLITALLMVVGGLSLKRRPKESVDRIS